MNLIFVSLKVALAKLNIESSRVNLTLMFFSSTILFIFIPAGQRAAEFAFFQVSTS